MSKTTDWAINKHNKTKRYLAYYEDNSDCQEVIEAKDENEAVYKTLEVLGITIVELKE